MHAPRCTGVTEVMLHDRKTLCCAVKRNGTVQHTVRAGSGELNEEGLASSAQVHSSRLEVIADLSPTVVQDDDCGAGPSRHQDDRPGARTRPAKHRLPFCSAARVRDGPGCVVSRPMRSSLTSRGTLLCSRMEAQDGSKLMRAHLSE